MFEWLASALMPLVTLVGFAAACSQADSDGAPATSIDDFRASFRDYYLGSSSIEYRVDRIPSGETKSSTVGRFTHAKEGATRHRFDLDGDPAATGIDNAIIILNQDTTYLCAEALLGETTPVCYQDSDAREVAAIHLNGLGYPIEFPSTPPRFADTLLLSTRVQEVAGEEAVCYELGRTPDEPSPIEYCFDDQHWLARRSFFLGGDELTITATSLDGTDVEGEEFKLPYPVASPAD